MVKEKEKFEREKYETNCIKKCSDDVNVNRNRMDKFEYNGNLYNETETCTTSKFPIIFKLTHSISIYINILTTF